MNPKHKRAKRVQPVARLAYEITDSIRERTVYENAMVADHVREEPSLLSKVFVIPQPRYEDAVATLVNAGMKWDIERFGSTDSRITHGIRARSLLKSLGITPPTECTLVRRGDVKRFRYFLNAQDDAIPHRHNRYHQRTRLYGDYLYAQDREKFMVDMREWLRKSALGVTPPTEPKSKQT